MATVSNVNQTGIWDTITQTATNTANSAANWLKSQNFSASAGDLWARVTEAAFAAIDFLKAHIGAFYDTAKTALSSAYNNFAALPLESKVVGGIILGVTTAAGFVANKVFGGSCNKTEDCKKDGDKKADGKIDNKKIDNKNDNKKPENKNK